MPWEADRNSYSAGGYAEEFGYSAQSGLPPPARFLPGDPELSKQWHVQTGAVHPGYPECPTPLDHAGILVPEDNASNVQAVADMTAPAAVRTGYSQHYNVLHLDRRDAGPRHLFGQIIWMWKVVSIRLRN